MTKLEIAIKSFNQLNSHFSGHEFAELCKKNGLEKFIKNQSSRINFRTEFCKQYANKSSLKTWEKKSSEYIHYRTYTKEINPQLTFKIDDTLNFNKKQQAVYNLLDIAKEIKNNNDRVILINAALMIIENDK
jgi:hypothetical protein